MATHPNDYALTLGFDHYPNYGSKGRPLSGAIADARAFHAWLTDPDVGGGVPGENCKLLVSSVQTADPPQPRQYRIDDALDAIWSRVKARRNDFGEEPRRFYLYFSGHGQAQTYNDVALCLPDWAQNRQGSALSFARYQDFLVECIGFQEVMIFLDCCRTRRVKAVGQRSVLTCATPHDGVGSTGIFVAQATEHGTRAFEAAVGVGVDDEPVVHGHFTEALLAALRGGAARPGGGVPLSALWTYLYKVVPRIAKRHDHEQAPRIGSEGFPPASPQEPVLGSAPPVEEVDVKITFTPSRRGEITLEGPDLKVIRSGDVSTGPWVDTLAPATYLLVERGTGDQLGLHLAPRQEEYHVEF